MGRGAEAARRYAGCIERAPLAYGRQLEIARSRLAALDVAAAASSPAKAPGPPRD